MARAGARPARLRVRAQVRPADPDRRPDQASRAATAGDDGGGDDQLRPAGQLGRVRRPGGARGHHRDDRRRRAGAASAPARCNTA